MRNIIAIVGMLTVSACGDGNSANDLETRKLTWIKISMDSRGGYLDEYLHCAAVAQSEICR